MFLVSASLFLSNMFPLSAGIDLILNNKLSTGVNAAPSDKENIEYFFKILKDYKINYISK